MKRVMAQVKMILMYLLKRMLVPVLFVFTAYIFVFCTLGCELVEIFLLIYIFSFHARVKP